MLFLKGVLVSMAGPTPNYAIQHMLSTRSPREAALENMVMAMVSLAPRFLLIAGITVLGIVFFSPDLAAMGAKVNFEKILPNVLKYHVPVGLKGILIAALLASFMSTFVSTVNSGAAYVVNDIYKRYINPNAPSQALRGARLDHLERGGHPRDPVRAGDQVGARRHRVDRLRAGPGLRRAQRAQVALVALQRLRLLRRHGGGHGGGGPQDLHHRQPGLRVPADPGHQLRGLDHRLPADQAGERRSAEVLLPQRPAVGSLGADLCEVPRRGLRPSRRITSFGRDAFNIAVGLVWQTSLVTGPIYLAIQHWKEMWISIAVFVVTSAILKFTWYDHLAAGDGYLPDADPAKSPSALPSAAPLR